jgi:hypothetical protein
LWSTDEGIFGETMKVTSNRAPRGGLRNLAIVSAAVAFGCTVAISAAVAASAVHGVYTVVQATGIDIAVNSVLDMDKSLKLKKGQSLILLSPSGERVEVDGPYAGKPADHLVAVPDGDTTMGYDFTAHDGPGGHHCAASPTKPRPSGGPNPDETGGSQNQTTHC